MIKLKTLIPETYPATVPDASFQKHGSGPADNAQLNSTPLKKFSDIQNQYPGHNHHLLLKCGNTQTCRCMAKKTEIIGICDKCAGNQ